MKLRRTPPPTKGDHGRFWWVRDHWTHGQIVPVRLLTLRRGDTFGNVAYERVGSLGFTWADDDGVEFFGPVEMPEEA